MMSDYTDGYAIKVEATLIQMYPWTASTDNGFCIFNDLYADCWVITTSTGKNPTTIQRSF